MTQPYSLQHATHQSTAGSVPLDYTGGIWSVVVKQLTHQAGTIVSGRKAVTTAGTAERVIGSSTPIYRVDISADLGNTEGPMVVGGSDVVALAGSQKGIVLVPGNAPMTLYIADLYDLWVDSQSNGDAICFTYYAA